MTSPSSKPMSPENILTKLRQDGIEVSLLKNGEGIELKGNPKIVSSWRKTVRTHGLALAMQLVREQLKEQTGKGES